jgi:hypothetical protein
MLQKTVRRDLKMFLIMCNRYQKKVVNILSWVKGVRSCKCYQRRHTVVYKCDKMCVIVIKKKAVIKE